MNCFDEITQLVKAIEKDIAERLDQPQAEIAEKTKLLEELMKEVKEIIDGMK